MEFNEIIEEIKPLSLYEKTALIKLVADMINKEHFKDSLDFWDEPDKDNFWDSA